MNRALARRIGFVVGIGGIIGIAVNGTLLQRRSLADYSSARSAVRADIYRYEQVLTRGEPRSTAAAALRRAGAHIESPGGDIVVTVLHELQSSSQCRSLVGQLHVSVDAQNRVTGWEIPPLNAECD